MSQLSLYFLNGGQASEKLLRNALDKPIVGNTDWPVDSLQGVFDHKTILFLAQQETDGGVVLTRFQLGIHCRKIEVELSSELGLERPGLEFHHDIATKFEVIEKKIDEELVLSDLDAVLTDVR